MNTKVKIMMNNPNDGTRYWHEVEGNEIKFAGFPGYKFLLHKAPDGFGWRISEATFGLYFAEGKN